MNQKKKITEKKYISFLNELKFEMKFNNVDVIRPYIDKHKVNSQWETFLKKKGIVHKDKKGLYIWNESHQPNIKMLHEFRTYVSHINKELRANNDIKNSHKVVVSKPSPSKELGLIRRFLKWIY